MKKKIIKIIIGVLLLISLMFVEYRFIMKNIKIDIVNDNFIQLEFMGQIDEYYID